VFFIKALILFFILFVLVFFIFFPPIWADIRQDFRGKGTSASTGGYPLALANIRQRIADIRNGLSRTISNVRMRAITKTEISMDAAGVLTWSLA
jgi:hypothetical protein